MKRQYKLTLLQIFPILVLFGCRSQSDLSQKLSKLNQKAVAQSDFIVDNQSEHSIKAKKIVDEAVDAYEQGDLNKAWTILERAIQIDPTYGRAYYNRGVIQEERGNITEAIVSYTQVVELQTENIAPHFVLEKAYNNRSNLREDLNDGRGAVEDSNAAIALNPNYAGYYANRGLAYLDLKNYDNAILDHTRAIELEPNVPGWYHNRGMIYRKAGNYQLALKDLNRAIELNSNFNWAYYQRGRVNYKLKDYQLAEADLTRAIELNYKIARIYYFRGKARQHIGKYKGAVTDFSEYFYREPKDPSAHYFLANAYHSRVIAYHNLGNYQAAKADAILAAEIYRHEGKKSGYQKMMKYLQGFSSLNY